jgi:hypothetical protein
MYENFSSMTIVIDLTVPLPAVSPVTKRKASPVIAKVPKPKKVPKKCLPHALVWVCSHGKGQGRSWGNKLKIVGVYASKDAAEQKKTQLLTEYDTHGHGDICVGETWNDEIDLVVKPCEEFCV